MHCCSILKLVCQQGKLVVEAPGRVGADALLLEVTRPGWHSAQWVLPKAKYESALHTGAEVGMPPAAPPAVVIEDIECNGEPVLMLLEGCNIAFVATLAGCSQFPCCTYHAMHHQRHSLAQSLIMDSDHLQT